MATKELKNIFLSASIPLPERDPKYFATADIVAIRDSIIAFSTAILPHHRVIWGGHPSITPLIYYVMDRLKLDIQAHVKLYQSLWFEESFPEDNDKFENIVFTERGKDTASSVQIMRNRMLAENEFAAAVFIGGMEGIEKEYIMFREKYPRALLLPIASTGAAAKIVYDNTLPDELKNERLSKEYGYMSLFQSLLLDKI